MEGADTQTYAHTGINEREDGDPDTDTGEERRGLETGHRK